MQRTIETLQTALGEAMLILDCSSYLLEAEHREPGRWREMVGILNGLASQRLKVATAATSCIEAAVPAEGSVPYP